jgi:hypothetical protein
VIDVRDDDEVANLCLFHVFKSRWRARLKVRSYSRDVLGD